MTRQALRTWIWRFSAILLCRSFKALSGWMGIVSGSCSGSSSLQRCAAGFKRGLWLGHSMIFVVPKSLLRCLSSEPYCGHCPFGRDNAILKFFQCYVSLHFTQHFRFLHLQKLVHFISNHPSLIFLNKEIQNEYS